MCPTRIECLFPRTRTSRWTRPSLPRYILATRDIGFLSETLTTYNSTVPATVVSLLEAAFTYRTSVIGTGPHGLMRVEASDGITPPAEPVHSRVQ